MEAKIETIIIQCPETQVTFAIPWGDIEVEEMSDGYHFNGYRLSFACPLCKEQHQIEFGE